MKKGICIVCVPGSTLDEQLALARAAGYAGVELNVSAPGQGPLTIWSTEGEVRALAARVHDAGLETPSLMGGGAHLISPDPEERGRGLAHLRAVLQRAAWLGAGDVLLHPGQLLPTARYDEAFEWLLGSLRELRGLVEDLGVGIGVENVWNKFLLSPREMRELIDSVDCPLIGCYFDVANSLPWSYSEQWVRILGRRIRRVHVKDFQRRVGTAAGFCQLLDGDANYPEVMRALREVGYSGYLTSEVDGDIAETSRRLDQILAMG